MKRAIVIALLPVVLLSMGARRPGIPAGHRHDAPKTIEDQNRENAERAQKQKEQANKNAPPVQPPPTTAPSQSAAYAKAQADLTRIERHLRDAFEKGEDYTKASGELKKSQDAYDAAYKSMVTKLSDQPAYAAAVGAQTKAESDLAAARAASADRAESAALAAQAMDARKAVHKLEADAADKDQAVKDAKAKIAESKSALDALKKTFEETLKADPEYAAAKQAVDAARPAKV